jgi:hypothetical protein
METRATQFKANAAECENAAKAASHKDLKQGYLEMAHQWRVLASEVRQSRDELRQQIKLSMELVNRSRQIIARIEDDWLAMFERR